MSMFMEYVKNQAAAKEKTPAAWLEGIIKHIPDCTLATHAGKFTHPSSRNVDINDTDKQFNLPYVVTAAVHHPVDIVINAAYMGTAKFLLYELEDRKNVLQHLQEADVQLQQEIEQLGVSFNQISSMVADICRPSRPTQTNGYIKQVYFPISPAAYHLVSVLPSSSIMIEVKKRMMEENDKRKECCDDKNSHYGEPYRTWADITDIHFGGTKTQNISALNSAQGGSFLALSSLLPVIQKKDIRIPKKDFFQETLPYKEYVSLFRALHTDILTNGINNRHVRRKREEIIDCIMQLAWTYCSMLREKTAGWSLQKDYESLPQAQKIWLDEAYALQRKDNETWERELATQFGRWVINKYFHILKEDKVLLGDDELAYVKKVMRDAIRKDVREH